MGESKTQINVFKVLQIFMFWQIEGKKRKRE